MTNTQAPISVIIPCYRCADTIERAVQSVASQTTVPAEVILVDDFSADGTLEKLYQLQRTHSAGWIKVLALPANRGPASARNAGWNIASEQHIALLDSDDTWHPQKIELQYDWMKHHPDFVLCGHASAQIDERARRTALKDYKKSEALFIPISKSRILLQNRIVTSTVILRKNANYRFTENRRYSEDYLLWLMLVCSGEKMARCELPMAFSYKAQFGADGLSAQLWNMEKGELENYRQIQHAGHINYIQLIFYSVWSMSKYLLRLIRKINQRPLKANKKTAYEA